MWPWNALPWNLRAPRGEAQLRGRHQQRHTRNNGRFYFLIWFLFYIFFPCCYEDGKVRAGRKWQVAVDFDKSSTWPAIVGPGGWLWSAHSKSHLEGVSLFLVLWLFKRSQEDGCQLKGERGVRFILRTPERVESFSLLLASFPGK